MGTYVVRRILNNNAFVSVDANGQEIVVMGKGIVFQKSGGDRIPCSRAEQVFQLSQENTSRFQELIARTDHIYSAVQRYQRGLVLRNSMRWEIQRYYPQEYAVGLEAARMVREALEVPFAEDEAAFMALHFVNAGTGMEIGQMYEVTELISGICTIVHGEFGAEFDTESLAYHRFITHVRFFAQRLLLGTYYQEDDGDLLDMICVKYPQAFAAAGAEPGP